MAAPIKNMRTIFPTSTIVDSVSTVGALTGQPSTIQFNTSALGSLQVGKGTVIMGKSICIRQVVVNAAARVRLYMTSAQRDADAGSIQYVLPDRPNTVQPTRGTQHGVIVDLYLDTVDKLTWNLAPPAEGFNNDTPQSTTIYWAVTNLNPIAAQVVTVTITFISQES